MSDCCDRPGYQTVFSDRFARRIARTYRKRGLSRTQLQMMSFLTEQGIRDASVLLCPLRIPPGSVTVPYRDVSDAKVSGLS